ncbi:MAG: hypothetical protein Q7L19_14855 [Pseudohongiella sp.]|nr:hypothetical protein [Pseudohongiella sp.]
MDSKKPSNSRTEIQIFSESLNKSEADYVALRDKLSEHGGLLDKYRKTAEAANAEANATGDEWRAALRASGGDVLKPVREIKRREIAARETAEEFASLVSELEPIFNDLKTAVSQARALYITDFYRVDRLRINAQLEATAQAVFSTEQGQEMLSLLTYNAAQVKADCSKDILIQELARAAPQSLGMSVDDMESEATRSRVQGFVYDFFQGFAVAADNAGTFAFQGQPLPVTHYEERYSKPSVFAAKDAIYRLKSSGVLS